MILIIIIIIIINNNVYGAVPMTMVTARVQPIWAVSLTINGCYHPHPPSPFVIITQPES